MTPQAIINVLDKHGSRVELGDGMVKWKPKREWFAQYNIDNQPLWVAWNPEPGVWIERETKFAEPRRKINA